MKGILIILNYSRQYNGTVHCTLYTGQESFSIDRPAAYRPFRTRKVARRIELCVCVSTKCQQAVWADNLQVRCRQGNAAILSCAKVLANSNFCLNKYVSNFVDTQLADMWRFRGLHAVKLYSNSAKSVWRHFNFSLRSTPLLARHKSSRIGK